MATSPPQELVQAHSPTDGSGTAKGHVARVLSALSNPPVPFSVHLPDGSHAHVGQGPPQFSIRLRSRSALRALSSLHQLRIANAYIAGEIDFEGDVLAAMALRDRLSDRNPWLKLWRRLAPALFGRERFNPAWIQKHYDSDNVQLLAADVDYNTYTPGIYLSDKESLEVGAERKLAAAFEALRVGEGDSVLDIGCGWGGFLRFAGRRGVRVTGITLSRDQLAWDRQIIEKERLPVEVHYQDFFTYEPSAKFDGINMMGVMEDLSDYRRVFDRIAPWLRPEGRVYLDFAAAPRRFGTGSFVTKHIWPGTFRMVYMPELLEALNSSPLEIVQLHNDRRNYHLWAKGVHDRWVELKDEIVARSSEAIWRTFHLLYAGCAGSMTRPVGTATAYRLVLQHSGAGIPSR
jgi:cyclopropane-fatty-acyl-phospholipid synthase